MVLNDINDILKDNFCKIIFKIFVFKLKKLNVFFCGIKYFVFFEFFNFKKNLE